jgi:hypothetical protein
MKEGEEKDVGMKEGEEKDVGMKEGEEKDVGRICHLSATFVRGVCERATQH